MYSPNIKYWTFEIEKSKLVFCLWLYTNTFFFMNLFGLSYRDSIYDILKQK
jgi:hypothetical protein